MDNKKRLISPYLWLLVLGFLSAVTLRTVLCLIGLDYESGYFTNRSLANAAGITLLTFCLILFSYIFFAAPEKMKASFSTPHTYIPSGIVGTSILFLACELLFATPIVKLLADTSNNSKNSKIYVLLLISSFVLSIISAIHFFLNAHSTQIKSTARGAASLATVLFFASYAALLYFNKTSPINAPIKIVDQMAFLFCALFFLYETRISLGTDKWRPYVAFGLVAALLSANSSIPALVVYFAKGEIISLTLSENVLMLSVSIFCFTRLLLAKSLPADKENKNVTALRMAARERAGEICELYLNEIPMEDEYQISIKDLLDSSDCEEETNSPKSVENTEDTSEAEEEILTYGIEDGLEISITDEVDFTETEEDKPQKIQESEAEDEENTGN